MSSLFEPEYEDRLFVFTDATGRIYVQHDHARGVQRQPQEIVQLLLRCAQSMAAAMNLQIGVQAPPAAPPPNGHPAPMPVDAVEA